ncbi:hypothetical protein CKO40_04855 [Halochromatium glycolicum]|jgi:hypothetical protein|uniref:Uncharacterized protein n=2 Tax=Halochromatium glycolicum TaxID=85075 RepID=A0AAJ0U295_9GAMM|nr:hypothetical protein [Halochromatium glycolicum]
MQTVSREQLKAEIDQLDSEYLGLAYRVIRQFPHRPSPDQQRPGRPLFSKGWHGRLATPAFSDQALTNDPKLAYPASPSVPEFCDNQDTRPNSR